MKNYFYTFILMAGLITTSYSQGIVINEASNGTGGSKEFIEFLVIGSDGDRTSPVDLTGWVFDDNNGDFEGLTSTGVAAGHYRFSSAMSAVPVGSLVVIYNVSDKNDNMPADDPTDSNADGVYIIPSDNTTVLEKCASGNPSSSNSDYTLCTGYTTSGLTWSNIGFRNGGDVIQVRKPDYSFYHGFSYGDVTAPFPSFPAELGGGISFNVATGSGTGNNFFLDCGSWASSTNYSDGSAATDDTPGLPNTLNNATLIDNIKFGLNATGPFDYSNLDNPDNCLPRFLAIDLLAFTAKLAEENVVLDWLVHIDQFENTAYFEVQRSANAIDFYPIGQVEAMPSQNNYEWLDGQPLVMNYYRLKVVESDGSYHYSKIRAVKRSRTEHHVEMYPNPTQDYLTVQMEEAAEATTQIIAFDMLGRVVWTGILPMGVQRVHINLAQWEAGTYLIQLKSDLFATSKRVIKQ